MKIKSETDGGDSEFRPQTLRSAGIGLLSYKTDGTIKTIDSVVLNQLELTEQFPDTSLLQGKNIDDLIQDTFPEGFIPQRIYQHKRVRDNQLKIKTLNGNEKWVLHDSDLVVDAETGDQIIYAALRVINRLKIAEDRLRESEIRYRTLFESSPYGIFIIDLENFRIVDANPIAVGMSAVKVEDLKRIPLESVFCGKTINMMNIIANSWQDKKTARLFEGFVYSRERRSIPAEMSGQILSFNEGSFLYLTVRDISEQLDTISEKVKLIADVGNSQHKIRNLSGLLQFCSC